ncbi:hypothetical protein [Jeotgalibacillus haloalkalitolerans]|uniref:Uncharacterized protein n=1 Tax=Jeotgalibacillus haloalkalitolerans TaxID=3104292 RepID=A0ABU5KL11_9BACL|nr:hypothetical protein [Jeotgalibacillus sp. HH7-29]MDZ5711626.1 hypothetical protein [Jeotgalibacillus sp. HH7-29]
MIGKYKHVNSSKTVRLVAAKGENVFIKQSEDGVLIPVPKTDFQRLFKRVWLADEY